MYQVLSFDLILNTIIGFLCYFRANLQSLCFTSAKMNLSTLRKEGKFEFEIRHFNEKWETKFLFTDFGGTLQLLLFFQKLWVIKEHNVRHHYETANIAIFRNVNSEARYNLISKLKWIMQIRNKTKLLLNYAAKIKFSSVKFVSLEMSFRSNKIITECVIKRQRYLVMIKWLETSFPFPTQLFLIELWKYVGNCVKAAMWRNWKMCIFFNHIG